MKSFSKLKENIDTLRQKQRDAVSKFKSTPNPSVDREKPKEREHNADVGAREKLAARLKAKRKAMQRQAMVNQVKSEVQQDSKADK
jgi:predicted  nucleic acid-binding Zn-ribbon protein|tara:strand:- start:300 stop:557 length:258 start_codon:yes stop_codon:yes gene_type:complete